MAVKQTAGRDALGEFAPKFAELNDDVLFGQVWSREDKLSLRDRSLVTVVALMAQGLTDSSFRYHLTAAKNNGITRTEIAEILTHAAKGGGQILVCVAGRGYYQEWGKAPQELHPGDVVNIPPEVKHWHGAAPDCWFSHLAVEVPGEGAANEWCEPVAEETYARLS